MLPKLWGSDMSEIKTTHVLIVGAGVFYRMSYVASRGGDAAPLYSTQRYDPYGTAALYQLLSEQGVDVRILLPKKSDSRIVTLASHSYYAPLLNAGVRIFEYASGFVHAKTMVVDDWVATIGSANMDMRSFKLNFELNAFIFGQRLCHDVAHQFAVDLDAATEVSQARSFSC